MADDIRLRLTDEKRKTIGQELLSKIRSARAGMAAMFDKVSVWEQFYEGTLPEKAFPWPDCSNVNVPLTQWVCDTYKARIADVLLSVSPLVLVEPPAGLSGPEYKAKAQAVEGFLQGYSERIGLGEVLADDILASALRTPAAVTKVVWREELKNATRYMPIEDEVSGEPVLDESGQPTLEPKRIEVQAHRGPRCEFVELENLVIWPLTAKSVQDCQIVGDRFRLTPQQVKERVKVGRFDRIAQELPSESEAGSDQAEELQAIDESIGIDRLGDYEQVSFWEVIAPYDVDGDGIEEDCVFTLEQGSGTIVRAIKFPYYHGIRYYDFCVLFPRPGRTFGRTMPQILEGSQRELNAIHNQRIDAITLAMSKSFTALKSSTIELDTLMVAPGSVVLVDSHDDIRELDISPQVPGLDAEQMARDYAERASGINDLSTGRETEEAKTATEVGLVASEAGIRFADTIRSAQSTVVNIIKQVGGLCYQYADDTELQAHGIERDDLIFPWQYVAHGNTGTANKAQQRQESMLLYNTLMQNPLVGQDLTRIWRLSQDILQAFDRTDTEAYLGTEDEAKQLMEQMQAQQAAQQAAQEAAMQAQGGEGGEQAGGMDGTTQPMAVSGE